MTIEIGAPVDAICPRCSADALIVAAAAGGEVTKIRCQECGVTYPDDAESSDASPRSEHVDITLSDDVPRKRPRRRDGPEVDEKPRHRRMETLVDFDVGLGKRPKNE